MWSAALLVEAVVRYFAKHSSRYIARVQWETSRVDLYGIPQQ